MKELKIPQYTPCSGPTKHDFGGPSRLVNGRWVRQGFTLTNEERVMFRAFGRLDLIKKIEEQKLQGI